MFFLDGLQGTVGSDVIRMAKGAAANHEGSERLAAGTAALVAVVEVSARIRPCCVAWSPPLPPLLLVLLFLFSSYRCPSLTFFMARLHCPSSLPVSAACLCYLSPLPFFAAHIRWHPLLHAALALH